MKKLFIITLLLISKSIFGQSIIPFNWEKQKKNNSIPKNELVWLQDSISKDERSKLFELITKLSQPATAQMLVNYFYIDGSFSRKSSKSFIDSIAVRPPDGDLGMVRVAYLISKFRNKILTLRKSSKFYVDKFSGNELKVPVYNAKLINKNIELGFDYQPSNIILSIISKSNIGYDEILKLTNIHQFEELISHHNQSFYDTPLTKEQLAKCLQIASSNEPLDLLYKFTNPDGLLYFTEVKDNLKLYQKQIADLKTNEKSIFNCINSTISPLLPSNAKFSRKVSFFFINGADGWASGDVTGIDLNYYKDDYYKLIPLLAHETYHSGQNAVEISAKIVRTGKEQAFVETIDYICNEGTASFVAAPSIKTKEETKASIEEGQKLFEDYFRNTIISFDETEAQKIANDGIEGAGPFYWLGAEMTRVIVSEFGEEKLASIIPYKGIVFFKTYFEAVNQSKTVANMFSKSITEFILTMK
jgi:Putative zinc dependent peptidase (DUF5700)